MVRAEFQRKDEALKTLQNMIETQVVNLQHMLKQEESSRYQSETLMKEDYLKFQEMFRKAYIFLFICCKNIKIRNMIFFGAKIQI